MIIILIDNPTFTIDKLRYQSITKDLERINNEKLIPNIYNCINPKSITVEHSSLYMYTDMNLFYFDRLLDYTIWSIGFACDGYLSITPKHYEKEKYLHIRKFEFDFNLWKKYNEPRN